MAEKLVYRIAHQFQIEGAFQKAIPYGSGHINDTYRLTVRECGAYVDYIVQRINHEIFTDCIGLMENIARVTQHLDNGLRLIPARSGKSWLQDGENFWRVYNFVPDTYTVDLAEDPREAYEVAHAFGLFHQKLADFPGPRLHDTIPDFHNTPRRFRNLQAAINKDEFDRARHVRDLIAYAEEHEPEASTIVDLLNEGGLPERIAHNDTKINNVLLSQKTRKGACVIDLDTVMPGTILYDFGDFLRTAASTAAEDEQDLGKVDMRMELFEAVANGYLSAVSNTLTDKEIELLPFSGRLIAYETGLRFLTDYLEGDSYFKIKREGHNIDRCRVQFTLANSMRIQEPAMAACIQHLLAKS